MEEKKIDYEKLLKLKNKNELHFWEKINYIHEIEGVILVKTDSHDQKKYITEKYNSKYQTNVENVLELTPDIWQLLNYFTKFEHFTDNRLKYDEIVKTLKKHSDDVIKIKSVLEKNNCFHWPFFNAYEELKRLEKKYFENINVPPQYIAELQLKVKKENNLNTPATDSETEKQKKDDISSVNIIRRENHINLSEERQNILELAKKAEKARFTSIDGIKRGGYIDVNSMQDARIIMFLFGFDNGDKAHEEKDKRVNWIRIQAYFTINGQKITDKERGEAPGDRKNSNKKIEEAAINFKKEIGLK